MRLTVLGFALALLTAQSVAWTDCCCGSFCQHKNECTGCGPEDRCPGGTSRTSSCCDEDGSRPEKTCSHQEPSSEIASVPIDESPTPPATLAPFMIMDLPPAASSAEAFRAPMDTGPPRAGPLDSLPRHLSLHVLLI